MARSSSNAVLLGIVCCGLALFLGLFPAVASQALARPQQAVGPSLQPSAVHSEAAAYHAAAASVPTVKMLVTWCLTCPDRWFRPEGMPGCPGVRCRLEPLPVNSRYLIRQGDLPLAGRMDILQFNGNSVFRHDAYDVEKNPLHKVLFMYTNENMNRNFYWMRNNHGGFNDGSWWIGWLGKHKRLWQWFNITSSPEQRAIRRRGRLCHVPGGPEGVGLLEAQPLPQADGRAGGFPRGSPWREISIQRRAAVLPDRVRKDA